MNIIKQSIYDSVEKMSVIELTFLYEHIQRLEQIKQLNQVRPAVSQPKAEVKETPSPLEKILAMTSASTTSWADDIVAERDDRL